MTSSIGHRPVFVPGRVNLIGEHTDYNDGLALAFAIDLGVTVTVTPTDLTSISVHSHDFGDWDNAHPSDAPWTRPVAATLSEFSTYGIHIDIATTVPVGAGLSSSAALIAAIALALGRPPLERELAKFVQACEVKSGNNVGLLDPLTVLAARADHGLLIDFSDTSYRHVAIPSGMGFTVVHSGIDRSLATSAYLERRRECSRAQEVATSWPPQRDDLDSIADATLRARMRHVVSENERVLHVIETLGTHDIAALGRLISESHASLRDDFDVSLPAIDELVEHLCTVPGVYGARLVGGGFGGCVLVIHDDDIDVSIDRHRQWRVHPSDGAVRLLGR